MKDFPKIILGLCAFFLIAGIAGHFDRQDEEICEMKNDGSYWELADRYPGADDARLIELRDSLRQANAQIE